MADTGLLISHCFNENELLSNEVYKSILFNKLSINKGMIYENIVSQMLKARKYKLYYFSHYDKKSKKTQIDINFLIAKGNKILPIEAKSNESKFHKSMDKFYEIYHERLGKGYIIHTKDYAEDDKYVYLPVYMTFLL